MHSIPYFNVVYKEQKTWFLYPVRDVILHKQYVLYPIRYELDVVNNICPIYNRNLGPESVTNLSNFCDKLGGYRRGTWGASIVNFCDSYCGK
jgi:hypothetical protein